MKRREFLTTTSLVVAGALTAPAVMHGKARPKQYDIVIAGAGPAGCIVATRLVDRFPDKSILLVEAGGPTSVVVGGRDAPPYDPRVTIFDVPGEYQNIPFQPKGEPYRQPETRFTFQGVGYGGNSQFNGMLFQAAPPVDFDRNWPAGWTYAEVRPYFDRVFQEMLISATPSADGHFYNREAADIAGAIYAANGFAEVNTSILGGLGERYFSHPYVVSHDGLRGGPVRHHLTSIVGPHGESTRANLEILPHTKVDRIVFSEVERSRAVGITCTTGTSTFFISLGREGRIVLAGGALMSPRLLLLSGVGPFDRHDEIFDAGFSVPFHIDNPGVGTGLFDHVATMLAYEYTGTAHPFRAYHYGDYKTNEGDLARYAALRAGPYAQYGPVSVMHEYLETEEDTTRQPNVEVFINPFGAGALDGPYNDARTLAAFAMLLRPRGRGLIRIGADTSVSYPPIYLTDDLDLALMTQAVQGLIRLYREDPALILTFGPGGRSHPHLNPDDPKDVEAYVGAWDPVDGIFFSRLIINHWGGTCPLSEDPGRGVAPRTLLVNGTRNIHVVDASLHPAPLSAHPVATIMAVAEKASDILSEQV